MGKRNRATTPVRHNQTWTIAVGSDQTADGTPTVEIAILDGADWETNSGGLEHGTLLRIRGWLSVSKVAVSAAATTVFFGIYVTDVDAPVNAFPPDVASFYLEDVLWTWGTRFEAGNASAIEVPVAYNRDVDVKAMRRITSDQTVRLAVITSIDSGITFSTVLRSLVRRGN